MQPGIVAAGERILSFISSFHCFFRQKKIFFLKKAAINTYIKKQKNKKHLTAHTDSIILLPLMRGRYMNGYQRPEAGSNDLIDELETLQQTDAKLDLRIQELQN